MLVLPSEKNFFSMPVWMNQTVLSGSMRLTVVVAIVVDGHPLLAPTAVHKQAGRLVQTVAAAPPHLHSKWPVEAVVVLEDMQVVPPIT